MSHNAEGVVDICRRVKPSLPQERPVSGVDRDQLARAVREILLAIGEDPDRDGLRDTPRRVAGAYAELFAGLGQDPAAHLARTFEQESEDLVALSGIGFTSICEHHLLPVFGTASVAYLPSQRRVVGLSKIARTVEVYARRPQLQERMTAQIADAIMGHLAPEGVLVLIEAEHMCMRMRGVRKSGARMRTVACRGVFESDLQRRLEALSLLQGEPGRSAGIDACEPSVSTPRHTALPAPSLVANRAYPNRKVQLKPR